MQKGDRECILMQENVINWDEDNPLSVGEDHIEGHLIKALQTAVLQHNIFLK